MDFTPGRPRALRPPDSVLTTGMFVIIPAEQTIRRSLHMQFRTHPWHGELRRPTDDDADKGEEDAEFDDDFDDDELDDEEDFDDDEEGSLLDEETDEDDDTGPTTRRR